MIMPAVRVKLTGMACVAHRDDLPLAEQNRHPSYSAVGRPMPEAPTFSGSYPLRPDPTLEMSLDTQIKGKVRGQPTFLFKTPIVLSHSLLLLGFHGQMPRLEDSGSLAAAKEGRG